MCNRGYWISEDHKIKKVILDHSRLVPKSGKPKIISNPSSIKKTDALKRY